MMIDLMKLREPFPPEKVSWRVGSVSGDKTRGLALAYIDARDVMERLDAVCGPERWQDRYPHANGKTVCEIGLRIHDEWIWKSDGAGDTDFEAEKGAISSAFKRAAVKWGIGRYLYDIPAPWVEIEPAGKSYRIRDSEQPKLRRLLAGGADGHAPEPAAPAARPAAPQSKFFLVDPATGKAVAHYERPSQFLEALERAMTSGDPVQWWGANGPLAQWIAERYPDKAARKVADLESLTAGAAA